MVFVVQAGQDAIRPDIEDHQANLKNQEYLQVSKDLLRIKKIYREMINKRWKFVNFKLGSFAENQRRLLAENMDKNYKPEV